MGHTLSVDVSQLVRLICHAPAHEGDERGLMAYPCELGIELWLEPQLPRDRSLWLEQGSQEIFHFVEAAFLAAGLVLMVTASLVAHAQLHRHLPYSVRSLTI